MKKTTTGSARLGAAVALAVAVSLPAGCGGATTTASQPGASRPAAHLDKTLHDMLPQSVKDSGVLRVGTDASYAPMSSFGPDGRTIVGAEPDLAVQLGHVLGVRLQFGNVNFDKLLGDVARGHLDLAMSAMTDTRDRARTADFVNYFTAGTSIVVQRGNPAGVTELHDLCGKVVVVENGTTQMDLLARTQKNCTNRRIIVRTYPTNSDAVLQIRTGRAAALLTDFPPASYLVNGARTGSQYQLATTAQYEPGLYGIVVAKGQPGLRDAIRGALETLMRDGVYTDVLARWHVQAGAVTQVTVNSQR